MHDIFEQFVNGKITERDYVKRVKYQHLIGRRIKSTIRVGHKGLENQEGVVVYTEAEEILVEFDNDVKCHDGRFDARTKDGHGWFLYDGEYVFIEVGDSDE